MSNTTRPDHLKGGSRKGRPNKIPAAIKEMIREALDGAGGVKYLKEQAKKNPAAFMALLGRIIPTELTGAGGGPVQFEKIERRIVDPVARAVTDAAHDGEHPIH